MTRRGQLRLIFHGALFLLISMSAGTPAFFIATHYPMNYPLRQYFRQSHAILMTTGIWMIATSMALPLLELTDRGISMLVWSLVISGYTFVVALVVLFVGYQFYSPSADQMQWQTLMATPYYLGWLYLALIILSGLTSFVPGLLIVWGSYKAAKHSILDKIH